MKNRFIKIIALSLASLMILMTIPAHADYSLETVEYKDSDEADFDNSAQVFAQIESEYKITIPKTIVLSGVSKTANYVVNVDGDIASYETINVVPDDTFALYSLNKNAQLASTTQDKTAWTYSTLGQDALGMVEANDITAGKWQGTFDFNVNMGKVLGDVIDPEFNDLTPDKILAGKTVKIDNLEVVGTATSSATAVASNISKDKTAYVNGELVIGTGEDVNSAYNDGYENGIEYADSQVNLESASYLLGLQEGMKEVYSGIKLVNIVNPGFPQIASNGSWHYKTASVTFPPHSMGISFISQFRNVRNNYQISHDGGDKLTQIEDNILLSGNCLYIEIFSNDSNEKVTVNMTWATTNSSGGIDNANIGCIILSNDTDNH